MSILRIKELEAQVERKDERILQLELACQNFVDSTKLLNAKIGQQIARNDNLERQLRRAENKAA